MKKIGIVIKETSENRIKNIVKDSSAILVIKYSGLCSPDLSTLRQNLKDSNATFLVVKNNVARRALQDSGLGLIVEAIEDPCGLVFAKEEPVAVSRVLCNFLKEHENLGLQGGVFKDRLLSLKDIESLARLPTREVLRAQLVMALNSPISGLAISLNQILAKFVYCIDQIRQKRTENK